LKIRDEFRLLFRSSAIVFIAAGVMAQTPAGSPIRGPFRASDLVELVKLDSSIKLDIRYATSGNFAGRVLYTGSRAFLQRPAAEALLSAHRWLEEQGYGLVIYDAYRPWSITKLFWEITPPDKRMFVADPSIGSVHNRGCAVDAGLYELGTGREVEMPSAYDEMSTRAFVTYQGGTAEQQARRNLLRKAMEREGYFFVYPEEWWHYNFNDFRYYPILDIPDSAISSSQRLRVLEPSSLLARSLQDSKARSLPGELRW
jgi:D-alanyl-D-alanine dipeptidase